jgi:hypothetical protein
MKRALITLAASIAAFSAYAGALPKDTAVRVEGLGIEKGWFEGKVLVTGAGCTMVKLDRKTEQGYTMLALIAIARLQRKDGAGWSELSVKDLQTREPAQCLEAGAD